MRSDSRLMGRSFLTRATPYDASISDRREWLLCYDDQRADVSSHIENVAMENRADYWKSQPRHFCKFCQCWTADNKPSRDFHEKGKRHQENVKKKLDELRKKGFKDAKVAEQKEGYLKRMEREALKQVKKDLKRDPSLAQQYGISIKTADPVATEPIPKSSTQPKKTKVAKAIASTSVPKQPVVPDKQSDAGCPWKVTCSPEGHPYYWNTATNEVSWTAPEGVDLPLPTPPQTTSEPPIHDSTDPQSSEPMIANEPTVSNESPISNDPTEAANSSSPQHETSENESTAVSTNQMHGQLVGASGVDIGSIPLPQDITANIKDPSCTEESWEKVNRKRPADKAYGKWERLREQVEQQVDLQLPEIQTTQEEIVIPISTHEPKIKFRERKVDKISQGLAEFRKRKKIERSIRGTSDDS